MISGPRFQEEYSAKLPALALLSNLGWDFLPPEQAMLARAGKTDEVVLRGVLREQLGKRRFIFGGTECSLSANTIDNLISEICTPALNEGLQPPTNGSTTICCTAFR
jgi:type I restriction enzyme R subunit